MTDPTHPPFRREAYGVAIDPATVGTVSNDTVTIAPTSFEVVRYWMPGEGWRTYARAIGPVVRKLDGKRSRITRIVTWSAAPLSSFVLPLSEMPEWARDIYDQASRVWR